MNLCCTCEEERSCLRYGGAKRVDQWFVELEKRTTLIICVTLIASSAASLCLCSAGDVARSYARLKLIWQADL
jgi:hypothetical protein